MTPNQWRVIFYMQVLKSYRDVLSADYQLQKERYRTQIADIKSESEEEIEDEIQVVLEQESLPTSIEEIDLKLEQLQIEFEREAEVITEPVTPIKLPSVPQITFEPFQVLELQSPISTTPQRSVEPETSISPPSTESANLLSVKRGSSKSLASIPEDIIFSDEWEPVTPDDKQSPPPPLFPELIILGANVEILGMDTIRLKSRSPPLPKIEEHCQTDFFRRPRTIEKPTIPKDDAEIFARSVRRNTRTIPSPYPQPGCPPCVPAVYKLATTPPPIRIEPYPSAFLDSRRRYHDKSYDGSANISSSKSRTRSQSSQLAVASLHSKSAMHKYPPT